MIGQQSPEWTAAAYYNGEQTQRSTKDFTRTGMDRLLNRLRGFREES